jgi:porin
LPITKKGFWFAGYAVQQYLMQSEKDPSVGWGLFTNVSISDGNPNPVKWSLLTGLAGNNLFEGREHDKWGIGYYHYGLSQSLIDGLENLKVYRRSEGGVECFYNYAITPWVQISADLQIIDPWKTEKTRETVGAIRLFTKI